MTTLNDKILAIFDDKMDSYMPIIGKEEAAKEIEKLIIKEQLDFLDWILSEIDFSNNTDYLLLKDTQSKLSTELNKLK